MAETLINSNRVTVWLLFGFFVGGGFFLKIAAFLSRRYPQRNYTRLPKPAYQKPEKSTIIEKTHIPISIFLSLNTFSILM